MKIVFAARRAFPFHGYGGMEKYVYFLAKFIQKYGHKVEIITNILFNDCTRARVYDGIRYTFIAPSLENTKRLKYLYLWHRFSWNVSRYLKAKNLDLVHAFGGVGLPYYCFYEHRKPIVLQPLGLEGIRARHGIARLYAYALWYPVARLNEHKADLIASEGEFQTRDITQLYHVSREKIFHLPIGVDISFIQESINSSEISREDIGLHKDDFVLITVNRLEKIKRVNLVIETLRVIKQRQIIPRVKLIIVGTGPEDTSISKLITKYDLQNDVLHFRDVEDWTLYNYYSLAHIYVSASVQREMLTSVLEGMACGLPIVSSTNHEGAIVEGENGYVVGLDDVDGLIKGILKIHKSGTMEKMNKCSKEIIKQHYTWDSVAKKAITEYERLIRARRESG